MSPTRTARAGTPSARLAAVIRDPVKFARGILGHDVYDVQAAILRSVVENRRTAVKACHASGKTFTAAEAALHWVTRYRDGVVITTAPTARQVKRLLWGEIHKSLASSRIRYPAALQMELRLGPNRYALGLSTNEGVNFQGFHGRILIIIDEAAGVEADIWEAIEGIRAGGQVHVLIIGNPTLSSGPFYDAFTAQRGSWQTFTISAFDTPNLRGLTPETLAALPAAELEDNPRPYLVSRWWVLEKLREWGPEHPMYQARVLGQFPAQSEDALISLAWIERARGAGVDDLVAVWAEDDPLVAGIDVAGPGEDETAVVLRRGRLIVGVHAFSQPDPRGPVAALLGEHRRDLRTVNVDSAGLGYYFARHLEDLGFPVRMVNVGESARNPERFANLKAELYWGLREWFREGLAGLTDETAAGQLATIRYHHDARGRVVIESKDDARKRGVRSPDRAEAAMLAFAPEIQTGVMFL